MDPLEAMRERIARECFERSGLKKDFDILIKDGKIIIKEKRRKGKLINSRFDILDL